MGHANGKIFDPVSITDVATVLGDSTNLALNENMNIWAKYKPFRTRAIKPLKEQKEEDRKEAAWGFYFGSDDPNAPCARNAKDLFDKIVYGDADWTWEQPIISRFGDFDGYNHYAVVPYETRLLTNNDYARTREISIMKKFNSNAEIFMEMMPPVDNIELEDYQIIGICRKENEQSGELINTNSTVYDLTGGGSETSVSFDTPLVERGTTVYYDFIFAATNLYTIGATESKWIYFPDSKVSFKMSGYYDMRLKDDGDIPMFEATNINGYKLTESTQQIKTLTLCFECFYNLTFVPQGKYILHAWNRENGWDRGQDYEFDLWADGQFKDIEAINIQSAVSGAQATDAMIAMAVYVNDPDDAASGMMNYTPYYFDFENNKLRLGVPTAEQGISIWRMKELYG